MASIPANSPPDSVNSMPVVAASLSGEDTNAEVKDYTASPPPSLQTLTAPLSPQHAHPPLSPPTTLHRLPSTPSSSTVMLASPDLRNIDSSGSDTREVANNVHDTSTGEAGPVGAVHRNSSLGTDVISSNHDNNKISHNSGNSNAPRARARTFNQNHNSIPRNNIQQQQQRTSQDILLLQQFWRTYDDIIILSLFAIFGIVFRLMSAAWFKWQWGVVFSEDSALSTNLPLNCWSCFLMGLLCSGR